MKRISGVSVITVLMASALAVLSNPMSAAAALPECDWSRTLQGAIVPTRSEADPANTSCQLDDRHVGRGVSRLQVTLNLCYFKNLEVDGDFGPLTERALREVQWLHGIEDDGVYGPITRDTMLHQANPGPPSCIHVNFPGGA